MINKKRIALFKKRKFQLLTACSIGILTFTAMAVSSSVMAAPSSDNSSNYSLPSSNGLLSFNFQNTSIKTILQIIATNSGLNFIISDSIQGNMSLSLQNVTWKEALNVVMQANGLDDRKYKNVLIIAPIEELASNDAKRMQAEQQLSTMAPPTMATIQLKYANADNLVKVIKGQQDSLLSPNGQIGIDPRTNTIWVKDTPANIAQVRTFITKLDVPAKQVLIEARIVSVDTEYVKDLGVRWGVSNTRYLSGTLKGANDLRMGNTLPDVPINDRLNFNLPANQVFGANPATLGLALIQIGSTYLDLELSALEGEQHGQVISNPRVITSNLQEAKIQTGEEIPYQEATSSGATSVSFKKAVLSLDITPQITSSKEVILNIKVTHNKRGTNTSTSPTTSVPAIDTEEVQSLVSLRDGQTIVIGGVYKQTKDNRMERIPFLGSLPVIGNLFKHTYVHTERNELLIFITPKIITSSGYTMTPNEEKMNQLGLSIDKGVNDANIIK